MNIPIIGQIPSPAIPATPETPQAAPAATVPVPAAEEFGGRGGLDPVRYGDWEKNGRCIDF